jgi:predicted MFS family arabinose efflux permease
MAGNSRSAPAAAEHAFGPAERSYEWKIVLLLSLTFGLVGLDRWILPPLFPAMMIDLQLDYASLGTLVGILGLSWGVCAILFGRLADRLGRRRILLPAVLVFSVMSFFSGLAGGFLVLVLVRAVMGVSEGAFTPVATAATAEGSHPQRRGLNQGIMMSAFALLGFGLAPIIATQLLDLVGSWRVVFMLVGIPGALMTLLLWKVLKEPLHLQDRHAPRDQVAYRAVWSAFNVKIGTLQTLCAMSCVIVFGTMVPSYLIDSLKLDLVTMGFVMSAMGFGGFAGEIAIPGLSDIIGRRLSAITAFVAALLSVWLFTRVGPQPMLLFPTLCLVAFFSIGLIALTTGPIATEAVPATATSSAIGLVSGVGEIFGGAVAPFIAGLVAAEFGIEDVFWVPAIGLASGACISFWLRETAPRLQVGIQ